MKPKSREAGFFVNALSPTAPQSTTPPTQNAGSFIRGVGATPLVPGDHREAAKYPLLTDSSDCATLRKASIEESAISTVKPEPLNWLESAMVCTGCGVKTRFWLVCWPGRKECVCRECFPQWAKDDLAKRKVFPLGASGGDVGGLTDVARLTGPADDNLGEPAAHGCLFDGLNGTCARFPFLA